ncbi:hypothetical protein [Pseudomonas sp. dw_358]|uniref:hypothetical protein n=1 Tax=Pseudomonas sp. dw_358 TaxID=2720083 RepID=UPI001BD6364E|nr:hypothetical protein [Pseudomonas sp. dw_358]
MTTDSPGSANNPAYHLLFGSLSMDLEPHWRQSALARQQTAIHALIETSPAALEPLLAWHRALRNADLQARAAASQLLAEPTLWQIVGVGHPVFDRLVQARGQGVLAEARMQQVLGFLAQAEVSRLEALVSGALQSDDTVYQVAFEHEARLHYVPGVLVLVQTGGSALLIWPGAGGGVQGYPTLGVLARALCGERSGDGPEPQWLPLAASYMANSVRAQWQDIQQHASAIGRGECLYDDTPDSSSAMERLRSEALEDLAIGLQPARSQALGIGLEEWRTQLVAESLPPWWGGLPVSDQMALQASLQAYLEAQRCSDALMRQDLPARDELVRRQLRQRVVTDFGAIGTWRVTLDLPEHVAWVKQPVTGSGSPGTPVRQIPQPSAERVRLSLDELAVQAIDVPMALRLQFLRVTIEASDHATATALRKGIDKGWLERVVRELDLAKLYEDALSAAFLGMPGETTEAALRRRETIAAPWRHRLQWQASSAMLAGQLSETGWQMVHCALHAEQSTHWKAPGWDLVMSSPMLGSGHWAGLPSPQVGLSGVMLLEERVSGLTVLYLPDFVGPRPFVEYPNMKAACLGIAHMTRESKPLDYFASRPVVGDPAAHAGYLREAHRRNFEDFIKPGSVWPVTTSLAMHQANVYLGRLVESHRSGSRSQADLYLEHRAISHGDVFNHIKMAIGMLPFLGVAVSVYDGWVSANAAVEAFLEGRPGEALDHIESVLLSIVDAGMDVLPAPSAGLAPRLRARTRLRQRHRVSATIRHASQPPISRLQGYEAEVSLSGLQPGSSGRYRGVYQHPEGDFIHQDGRVCRVQWDDSLAIWRLAATSRRGYRQPVVLDDFSQWTTYGALTGQLVPAGAGGGAWLGRLAQEGWAGTSGFLRRRLLGAETEAARAQRLRDELNRHLLLQDAVVERFDTVRAQYLHAPDSAAGEAALMAASDEVLGFYKSAVEKALAALGDRPPTRQFSTDLGLTMESVIRHERLKGAHLLHAIQEAIKKMKASDSPNASPDHQHAAIIDCVLQLHRASSAGLANRLALEAWVNALRPRRAAQPHLPKLEALLKESATALDHRAAHLSILGLAAIDAHRGTPAARFALDRYHGLRSDMVRAAFAYRELKAGKVNVSSNERHALLDNVLRQLRRLEANEFLLLNDSGVFNPTYWQEMRRLVDALILEVSEDLRTLETSLSRMTAAKAAAREVKNQGAKRMFETEDEHLLIGSAHRTGQGDEVINIHEPISGQVIETFSRQPQGTWRSNRAKPAPLLFQRAQLASLLDGARRALDEAPALTQHVQALARKATVYEPRDLEHMLSSQADVLSGYAQQLHRLAGDQAAGLLRQLEGQATSLRQDGIRIRIVQTKRSLPTGSRMAYLLEQGEARIERLGDRIGLRNARGRVSDHLQEYVIIDQSTGQPIWYAHFHYEKAAAPFAEFARAHLKTIKQRKQGRQSQMLQEQSGHTVTPLWRERLVAPFIEPFAALQ